MRGLETVGKEGIPFHQAGAVSLTIVTIVDDLRIPAHLAGAQRVSSFEFMPKLTAHCVIFPTRLDGPGLPDLIFFRVNLYPARLSTTAHPR